MGGDAGPHRLTMRERVKRLVARALRPATGPLVERLDRLEAAMAQQADSSRSISGPTPETRRGRGRGLARKHREELRYWRWLIKGGGSETKHGGAFHEVSRVWRRSRLEKLGEALGVGKGGIDAWCQSRTVVEIGAGPAPTVALAGLGWARCIAVDPLASAYVRHGLLSPDCGGVVYVEADGERVPLPGGVADLVICENCLDHVSDPAAVVGEMRRLLKPGGVVWLFVDVSTHVDEMHPHPMTESGVRGLFEGFEVVLLERVPRGAHPKAEGALRGLFRKG